MNTQVIGDEKIMAKEDDKHEVTIHVNGSPHEVEKNAKLSYTELVQLEFPDYTDDSPVQYSVDYEGGPGNKDGQLLPGDSVKVKDGMVFDVTSTGES